MSGTPEFTAGSETLLTMPNLRLCSTLLFAAILGGCQQAPVGSAPAQSAGDAAVPVLPASAAPASSGTAVGARMLELRGQEQQLKASIDRHLAQLNAIRQEREAVADKYYAAVGEISAKLHVGTTPSNPILTAKWTEARGLLDQLEINLSHATALSNDMATDGQTGAYLDDSTQAAFAMPGALDEDHVQLHALQADVASSQARIGGEMIDVTNEINRQNEALGIERNNIATLAEGVRTGQFLGHNLANPQTRLVSERVGVAPAKSAAATGPGHDKVPTAHQHHHKDKATAAAPAADAPNTAAPETPAPAGVPAAPAAPAKPHGKSVHASKPSFHETSTPLMVIRFDRYTERYEAALYNAVSRALQKQPNASFRIVGLTPEAPLADETSVRLDDVRRHVAEVQRSLLAFGLTPARISTLSEASGRAPVEEVRLYKR